MKLNSRTEEEIEEAQRQQPKKFSEWDPETFRKILSAMANLQHGTGTDEWLAPLLADIQERVFLWKMLDVICECEDSSDLFGRAMFIAGMDLGWRIALKDHQVSDVA